MSWSSMFKGALGGKVPVTMGELWGPVKCKECEEENVWTIWVEPEIKEEKEFKEIYRSLGVALCEACEERKRR